MKVTLGILSTFILLNTSTIAPVMAINPILATNNLDTEVNKYRPQGYQGITTFKQKYGTKLTKEQSQALDRICGQKDCDSSSLYWYTDLTQAKVAAKASGKPILSLRLLGNLTEELSCANSRFFRTILYPNQEISSLLKDKYILHWQSVRPVPKLTIDFGDGRKIEQTITGNSIHYLLDSEGKPIDALPGLYTPQSFKNHLTKFAKFYQDNNLSTGTDDNNQRGVIISQYHRDSLNNIQQQWQADLNKLGINLSLNKPTTNNNPTAVDAAPIAVGKMMVESPFLRQMTNLSNQTNQLTESTDDRAWQKLGELYQDSATIDSNSQALMRRKSSNPENFPQTLAKFQKLLSVDSIRNEYLLHSQLHQWFINNNINDLDALNERVYAELFLTPSNDRWLGLVPGDSYSAIENNGKINN